MVTSHRKMGMYSRGSVLWQWISVFLVTYWYLWNWMNKVVFEEGFQRPWDSVFVVLEYMNVKCLASR